MQTATVTYVDYVPRGGVGEAQPQTSPQEQQQPQAPGHRPRSSFAQSAYQHADRGSGPENVPSGPDLSAAVARSSAESSSPEPSGDEDGQLAFVLQQQEVADSSMSQEGKDFHMATPVYAGVSSCLASSQECNYAGGARIRTSGLSDGRHLQDDPHLSQQFQTRLSGAQYGKHTPRVNSVDMRQPEDFMTDRELLCHRLEMYGLCERRVKGDGNCQFRALSDQLYQTPHTHKAVRKLVVERLQSHAKLYSAYVPADYEEYCSSMELSGTWGDHITLQVSRLQLDRIALSSAQHAGSSTVLVCSSWR